MAGQKFQYDESGGTFCYFILSFLALLLIPGTYYWWPRTNQEGEDEEGYVCGCPGCLKKKIILKKSKPWKSFAQFGVKAVIVLGWCALAFLTYKVSQFDYEYAHFDPYEILGVPLGSSEATIKKAYRRLSLILHPDKETGNEKSFMKLTKAYQALTDEEARKNYERYGNPDGPGAMSFGIALPSWIVEKENSIWVLGLYGLVFMVAMPTVVGTWWYKSIKYSSDKILLDTSRMYYYFFHKTPSMPLKRVIMILAASLEFERKYNDEIAQRETDTYEMPRLINTVSQLHNLGEKNRERPLYYAYSLKARALIYAHLSRIPLTAETLDIDRMAVVKKCPMLIQEMISCISQLILLAYAQRVSHLLNIETLENAMKLCPMIVQGMWECKSPFLQLPYIKEEHLRHFVVKKRYIRNIQQLAHLKHEDRRHIMKFLTDEQYAHVMNVVSNMPNVEFKVRCEVIDDEASTVYTAGAIMTVTVSLKRGRLGDVMGDESVVDKSIVEERGKNSGKNDEKGDKNERDGGEEDGNKKGNESGRDGEQQSKPNMKPIWQKKVYKNPKKAGKKGSKKEENMSKAAKKKLNWERKQKEKQEQEKSEEIAKRNKEDNEKDGEKDNSEDSDFSNEDSDKSDKNVSEKKKENCLAKSNKDGDGANDKEDEDSDYNDEDWQKFQTGTVRRDKLLDRGGKMSHPVHCPYFPEAKQEYWWTYVSDRKSRTLLTTPHYITSLKDSDEIQLRFTAPRWTGLFTFAVCLRSDSYIGFDQMTDIKLDVKEAPEVPLEHPQWDISDEDDESQREEEAGNISEFTTDSDVE